MADTFTPSLKNWGDFNGGEKYTNTDTPSPTDFNNLVESALYAQNISVARLNSNVFLKEANYLAKQQGVQKTFSLDKFEYGVQPKVGDIVYDKYEWVGVVIKVDTNNILVSSLYSIGYKNYITNITKFGTINTTRNLQGNVQYNRLSPKSGLLSISFAVPTYNEDVSNDFDIISLADIESLLGITINRTLDYDTGYWQASYSDNLSDFAFFDLGISCHIGSENNGNLLLGRIHQYEDGSKYFGAWSLDVFMNDGIIVSNVYIEEV